MSSDNDSSVNGAAALSTLPGHSVGTRTGAPAGSAVFAPFRFSTRELRKRDRVPMWREAFGRGVVGVDIEPFSAGLFRAEATLRALPGLRTIAYKGSLARNRRTPAQTADGDDCIGLFVNLGRKATASQHGRDVVLGRGDAVLISHDPSVVIHSTGFLGVIVPHAALASRVRDIDDAAMRLIPRAREPLQLLKAYMRSLPKELVCASPKLRRTVVNHICDLVALAICPDRATRGDALSAVTAARLAAALGHIAESFEDASLTVAAVAGRQGISPRYLQYLLETSGISFTARVNELRLQRAFALLTNACGGTRGISEIALQVGFSDISHFNRLFKSRFGDTPGAVRAEGRAAQTVTRATGR